MILEIFETRAALSQVEVAKIVSSSQPRVAKMEAADKTVSIDRGPGRAL